MTRSLLICALLGCALNSATANAEQMSKADPNPLILPADHLALNLDRCFQDAAYAYGIDTRLLRAIAQVESGGDVSAVHRNGGGRGDDLGVMQINTRWLGRLAAHGIDQGRVLEPCTNIHIGAWVLKGNIARYGSTWRAVGAYNASPKRPDVRVQYARKVMAAMVETSE